MPKLCECARAVVAYIVRDGLMLSIPRRNTGEHAAPGGQVERNGDEWESWETALSREVDEEIGCRVLRAWRVYAGCVNGFAVMVYRVDIEGEPYAREPGTQIEWVTPEQIANGFASELHQNAVRAAGLL
jgi:8-oxo-dGTP pyrophosphatase MutT (NUDIX family)